MLQVQKVQNEMTKKKTTKTTRKKHKKTKTKSQKTTDRHLPLLTANENAILFWEVQRQKLSKINTTK